MESYWLEIYEPDSTFLHSSCISNQPFPRISYGDKIIFGDSPEEYKVKDVVHLVLDNQKIFTIKTMIYVTKTSQD